MEIGTAVATCKRRGQAAQSPFKQGLAHMRLSRTSLPNIVERIRELIRAIEDPVGRTEAGEDMLPAAVIRRAGEKLLDALSPNGVNLFKGNDISDSTLDLKTKARLLDLHSLLTTFAWAHRVLDHKEQSIVSLEEVVRELEADPASAAVTHNAEQGTQSGAPSDEFLEFPKKQRNLLYALRGKGKVPIRDVVTQLYGRGNEDRTVALLKLKDRTNRSLIEKGRALEIKKEGETLQLTSISEQ